MLLSVSSCDVNVPDADYVTPLITAAMNGNSHICELLVSHNCELLMSHICEMLVSHNCKLLVSHIFVAIL